jgi:hypothetical protein
VALTGRFNFRRTLSGRIVLQVEEDKPLWWSRKGKTRRRYRDATVMDLAKPEMRALIDLRNKPQFLPAAAHRGTEELGSVKAGAADGTVSSVLAAIDRPPEGRISAH